MLLHSVGQLLLQQESIPFPSVTPFGCFDSHAAMHAATGSPPLLEVLLVDDVLLLEEVLVEPLLLAVPPSSAGNVPLDEDVEPEGLPLLEQPTPPTKRRAPMTPRIARL